ncbi:hypothetical protein SAMN04487936_105112 [Halobacillus dabanensis]|uniref:Uncharacterized protein n=1 Tax=Halobacillus dabanensis TaxID=240302 RepID=A0A1I3V5N0_HALDA|nr:hypothetical protein [Halobacillus dabanensis]SFJ89676.1 hypothetical protein SAMN04487936_105112 [Halobacillus dabanensis]
MASPDSILIRDPGPLFLRGIFLAEEFISHLKLGMFLQTVMLALGKDGL